MAVQEALHWLEQQNKLQMQHIHIFTDSKFTLNASTSPAFRKKHYYIVQEIQNIAHRIKTKNDMAKISMHYVPSHIENTIAGLRRTGNYYADKLATQGVLKSKETDHAKRLSIIREKILNETIDLIEAIETKLNIFKEPDSPSTASAVDDLGARAYADRDSSSRGVP